MGQVGPRKAPAELARTVVLDGRRVVEMALVADVQPAARDPQLPVPGDPRRQDRIEQVHAPVNRLEGRPAIEPHEVARPRVVGQQRTARSSVASRCSGVSSPASPPRQIPSNGRLAMNRVDSARSSGPGRPGRSRTAPGPAPVGGERGAPPSGGCGRWRHRDDLARRRRHDRLVEGDRHVRPERLLDRDRVLGVKRCVEPSMWLRNVTPSSSTIRRSPSDTTWYPPESVRIGRSQAMKRCSPPNARCARARPQVQVVRVGEDDRGAGRGDFVGIESLHRRVRPDRHELRRLDDAVRQLQPSRPGARRSVRRRRDSTVKRAAPGISGGSAGRARSTRRPTPAASSRAG